jgi:DNA-binding CsgD family transcriptional regulator
MKYFLLSLYIGSYCSGFASLALCFVVWKNTGQKGFILYFGNMVAFLLRILAINLVFFLRSFLGIEGFQDSFAYFAGVMVITAFFDATMVYGAHGIVEREYGRFRQPILLAVSLVPLALLVSEAARRLSGVDSPAGMFVEYQIAMEATSIIVVYCFVFFCRNLDKAGNSSYRAIMKAHIVLSSVMIPLYVLQILVNDSVASGIKPLSVADNLYFFVVNLVAIFVLAKNYLLTPAKEPAWIEANYSIGKCADLELTERESEIVGLLSQGLANKEIADKLCISPATVKNHIYNIYQKTGVKSRVELLNALR